MCGIAGFERNGGRDAERAAILLKSLDARGPDGGWAFEHSSYGLVQTRLSIVDLSEAVVYPMPNEDETVWLLFNGEIYNHHQLRGELQDKGHRFRTRCDAEVVVHGYEEWSLGVFERLNGMFAIAILDESEKELVLARDRLGIKPLVRTTTGRFAFASDAMSLVRAGLSGGELDYSALREFVTFHYIPHPRTGIADIEHVEPGAAVVRRADSSEQTVRWTPEPFSGPAEPEPVSLEEADIVLRDSVARQLEADVNVGILLSGGIDSSLVLAYAVELGIQPPNFTIAFRGHGDYDESDRAAHIARSLGVPHHTEDLSTDFAAAVAGVAAAFDQPFADSSAIAMLALSRLARQHVTVALSGTGGDDLFAGYYRHRAHRLRRFVACIPEGALDALSRPGGTSGAERRSAFTLAQNYVGRFAAAGGRSDVEQYLALIGSLTSQTAATGLRFPTDPRVVRSGVGRRLGLTDAPSTTRLRQLQRFELKTYLPGDLLVKEDRAAMSCSLEARVPLLDNEVLDLAERARDSQKTSLRSGKILLRELAQRKFGAVQGAARKRGFAVPLRDLLQREWRADALEWFRGLDSDLVDGPAAAALLESSRASAAEIWSLATLAGWEARLRTSRVESQRIAA